MTHRDDMTGDSLVAWAGPGVFVAASICSVLIIQEEGVCAAGYFFCRLKIFAAIGSKMLYHTRAHARKNDIPSTWYPPCASLYSHCCCCLRRSTSLYRFAPCLFVVYVPLHLCVYACLQSSRGSGTFLEYCSGIASFQTIQLHDNAAPALRWPPSARNATWNALVATK